MSYRLPSRVLIVGLGRSGTAAARLAAAGGAEVWATDRRPQAELEGEVQALPEGARTFLGGHPEESLEGVGLLVVSPGVAADAPILQAARGRGIELAAEIEFAWRHRKQAPLAAVTGSNGKSTVTELVALMLRESGQQAAAGGNLGTPASQLVLDGGWESWVLEVSSFQAELLTEMAPRAAVFLNLSQDHLERHPDLEAYLAAKRRLFAFQGAGDTAVLNADDPAVAATVTAARRRFFSLAGAADAHLGDGELVLDGEPLVAAGELRLSGRHNLANAAAAALAATALGASRSGVAEALRRFDGLAHRHRTVHIAGGVRWVDDSKATNVGAALAALGSYPDSSVHLILGGQAKGQDFSLLAPEVRRAVARLYLIGVDGAAIGNALAGCAPTESCTTLEAAVESARTRASAGQWVLLAPACASFDQFANYGERGDRFAALAREEVVRCP
ncbi:MAG TPA: UDP-N-acetylmuramoyl-L-alanine--D-glutamate ligase [Chondromyces sp.]|nr:UDP-N-acetylmuramoyl-L-alanine--D-glutamate ligase [Chondromyces sp.]